MIFFPLLFLALYYPKKIVCIWFKVNFLLCQDKEPALSEFFQMNLRHHGTPGVISEMVKLYFFIKLFPLKSNRRSSCCTILSEIMSFSVFCSNASFQDSHATLVVVCAGFISRDAEVLLLKLLIPETTFCRQIYSNHCFTRQARKGKVENCKLKVRYYTSKVVM